MIGDRKTMRGERAAALNKIENVAAEIYWHQLGGLSGRDVTPSTIRLS